MALKGWDNTFSVSHATLDADHKQLVKIISHLHETMKAGQSKPILEPLIKDLTFYATNHFSREEKYLKEKSHPDLNEQIQQHKLFLDKIIEFRNSFESGETVISTQMLPFLNNWFLNHIMKTDMKYK